MFFFYAILNLKINKLFGVRAWLFIFHLTNDSAPWLQSCLGHNLFLWNVLLFHNYFQTDYLFIHEYNIIIRKWGNGENLGAKQ